jgi:hypothetical protein
MSRPKTKKPLLDLILCLAAGPAMTAFGADPKKAESSLTFIAQVETSYININKEQEAEKLTVKQVLPTHTQTGYPLCAPI